MSTLQKILLACGLFIGSAVALLILALLPPIGTQVRMPSVSMAPNLMAGDILYVSKAAYTVSDDKIPERGDIIMYKVDYHKMHLMKRVVGLPEDTVQLRAGRLYLNGDIIERRHRKKVQLSTKRLSTLDLDLYTEQIASEGLAYAVFEETDTSRLDDTQIFKVPAGHVFVMGDNRDNSMDSRMLPSRGGSGFVPLENILGEATRIIAPTKSCRNDKGYYCPKRKAFEKL